MKAAAYHRTGPPEVLQYEDVPDPEPKPGEVLSKVEAISIEGWRHAHDCQFECGHPQEGETVLVQAAAAHAYIESRQAVGRVVLAP